MSRSSCRVDGRHRPVYGAPNGAPRSPRVEETLTMLPGLPLPVKPEVHRGTACHSEQAGSTPGPLSLCMELDNGGGAAAFRRSRSVVGPNRAPADAWSPSGATVCQEPRGTSASVRRCDACPLGIGCGTGPGPDVGCQTVDVPSASEPRRERAAAGIFADCRAPRILLISVRRRSRRAAARRRRPASACRAHPPVSPLAAGHPAPIPAPRHG